MGCSDPRFMRHSGVSRSPFVRGSACAVLPSSGPVSILIPTSAAAARKPSVEQQLGVVTACEHNSLHCAMTQAGAGGPSPGSRRLIPEVSQPDIQHVRQALQLLEHAVLQSLGHVDQQLNNRQTDASSTNRRATSLQKSIPERRRNDDACGTPSAMIVLMVVRALLRPSPRA